MAHLRWPVSSTAARCFSTTNCRRKTYDRTTFFKRFRFGETHRQPNTSERSKRYDEEYAERGSFQNQLRLLNFRGFRRPYTPYDPPANMESRFLSACARILPEESLKEDGCMAKVDLRSDFDLKGKLLNELSKEMDGHAVPNSMIHLMTSLDKLFHFYSVPVDQHTSYERLEAASKRGELPPNLHMQLDPYIFDAERAKEEGSTQLVALVDAYPKSTRILSKPETRKKYKEQKSKANPWKLVPPGNKDEKLLSR